MPTTAPSSRWTVRSSVSMDCGVSCPVARASSVIAPSSSATPRVSTASGESGVSMRAVRLKARAPSRSTVPASVAPRSGRSDRHARDGRRLGSRLDLDRAEAARVERDVGRRQREVDSRLLHRAAQRRAPAHDGPEHAGGGAFHVDDTRHRRVEGDRRHLERAVEAIAVAGPGEVAGDRAFAPAERDAGAAGAEAGRTARGPLRDRRTGPSRRPGRR